MEIAANADDGLRITINNKQPVELLDLTRSFMSFADEYRRFASTDEIATNDDLRLYITRIESGSIIAELIAGAPALAPVLPFIQEAHSLLSYGKHLKKAYDFLLGKEAQRPNVTKQTLQNLSNFVEPIAKDRGSQINIGAVNGDVYLNINSTEANAVQNAARREIERIKDPETGEHPQVLLYWYQARNERGTTAGDKAIIESISPRAVKVAFADESIKTKMVFDVANPFREAYVVDVVVETMNGKPGLYRITALHDKFDREDSDV